MHVLDVLNLCLSLLGINSLILSTRYLLPHNAVSIVSILLDEAHQLLGCAEEIGAVPPRSKYKRRLDRLMIQFLTMRIEINHAQGMLQQLRIGLWCGLTWKLFPLHHRIKAIKSELELEVDEKKLDSVRNVVGMIAGHYDLSFEHQSIMKQFVECRLTAIVVVLYLYCHGAIFRALGNILRQPFFFLFLFFSVVANAGYRCRAFCSSSHA